MWNPTVRLLINRFLSYLILFYHVYSVYALLKVVGYYDLNVLSMSVMVFQKKFVWGWVGGESSIQFFLGFV